MRVPITVFLTVWLAGICAANAARAQDARTKPVETPMFAEQVRSGKLPPVAGRLPQVPLVDAMTGKGRALGRHGGTLRILMARAKDVRLMVVYGYARLVAFNAKFQLVPDILERFEVAEGRRFTLYLRKGHKWSDGQPFGAEDFRYFWQDVANNQLLSPVGPPRAMLVDGKPPRFEVIDSSTLRYT